MSAYLLCGGKSSRMGEEKGLVELHGKPFVQWILEAVFPVVAHPVLVTANPDYQAFSLQTIPDAVPDMGPVGGIFTALNHSDTAQVLILSCDIPKITTEVIMLLAEKAALHPDQIVFVSDGKNDYPLIASYPKSCLGEFKKALTEGRLKLRQLVATLPHHRIEINPERTASLQNINTKTELNTLLNPILT